MIGINFCPFYNVIDVLPTPRTAIWLAVYYSKDG